MNLSELHPLLQGTIVMSVIATIIVAAIATANYRHSRKYEKQLANNLPYPFAVKGNKLHVVKEDEMDNSCVRCIAFIRSCITDQQLSTAYNLIERFRERYGKNASYELLNAEYIQKMVMLHGEY